MEPYIKMHVPEWQPRSAYRRSVDRATGTRVHQCPGCWAIALVADGVEYECQCGERMTLIDLRARSTRPLNEDES
jgi:hypothetical protein